jgi:cytochrome c556
MKYSRDRRAAAAVVLVAASLVSGCAAPAPEQPPAPAEPPFRPVASIREVMNSVIDPSVDEVWNAVRSVVDDGRLTDHAPVKDEDWAEVRRHALVVIEAANLLLMHDRPVAPPGAPSLAPGVELTPEEIRSLIDKNPDGWNFYVQEFQDSLKPALAAIDAKNAQALFDAGEKIDTTCENCHSTFWYPKAVASSR